MRAVTDEFFRMAQDARNIVNQAKEHNVLQALEAAERKRKQKEVRAKSKEEAAAVLPEWIKWWTKKRTGKNPEGSPPAIDFANAPIDIMTKCYKARFGYKPMTRDYHSIRHELYKDVTFRKPVRATKGAPEVCANLLALRDSNDQSFTDVELVAGDGAVVRAHACVLASQSIKMRAALATSRRIDVPSAKNADVINCVLKSIYLGRYVAPIFATAPVATAAPSSSEEDDDDDSDSEGADAVPRTFDETDVLRVLHALGMTTMKNTVASTLGASEITPSNAVAVLLCARETGASELEVEAVRFIGLYRDLIFDSEAWKDAVEKDVSLSSVETTIRAVQPRKKKSKAK